MAVITVGIEPIFYTLSRLSQQLQSINNKAQEATTQITEANSDVIAPNAVV
ncbi:hypothetical protein OH492_10030 [Vibrio chagasii]|nr:hypothetical protein [Vibrio chagasii]